MRGKVNTRYLLPLWAGITPAYAGKRAKLSLRVCTDAGSPPPMRGKANYALTKDGTAGITPAYAGKR